MAANNLRMVPFGAWSGLDVLVEPDEGTRSAAGPILAGALAGHLVSDVRNDGERRSLVRIESADVGRNR